MTTLHDRLSTLADDAPAALPEPDLWDRGRRYAARRRTGTLLIVGIACAALVALAGFSFYRAAPPQPVPADAPLGFPDRFYAPSRWLPGTDEDGPLGPLAAVLPATRQSWGEGERSAYVGVSAATGDYRFLDLPDLSYEVTAGVGESDIALSPDGRHVAYWYVGTTRLAPGGTLVDGQELVPVVGYAVYDAMTGRVERRPVDSDHGLYASALGWADEQTVVAEYGFYDDAAESDHSSASGIAPELWRPGTAPTALPRGWRIDSGQSMDSGPFVFRHRGHRTLGLLQPGTPPRFEEVDFRLDRTYDARPALDATNQRAAALSGMRSQDGASRSDLPSEVVVADLPDGAYVPLAGSEGSAQVLRWIGDEVVVQGVPTRESTVGGSDLRAIDVTTGEVRTLVDGADVGGWQVATELLTLPGVEGREPPRPLDPRRVTGWAVATVLLAGWGLVWWRRRVRP